jgi:hypothetical protein
MTIGFRSCIAQLLRSSVLLSVLLLSATSAVAQRSYLDGLYQFREHLTIDKFEREHVPLDGRTARMIPFRKGSRFGFVKNDRSGDWLIKPRYEQVFAVYGSQAIVKDTGADYGVIDMMGTQLTVPAYRNLFREGSRYHGIYYTSSNREGKPDAQSPLAYGNDYYDTTGKMIFHEVAHDFRTFKNADTLAWFRYGPSIHIRSLKGQLVKTLTYDTANVFLGICENLLLFGSHRGDATTYEAKDLRDRTIFRLSIPQFSYDDAVYRLSPDLFALVSSEGAYWFCNAKGEELPYGLSADLRSFPEEATYFRQGQIVLRHTETNRYGAIDQQGHTVIPFQYRHISDFVNGKAFAIDETKGMVYIDTTGHTLRELNRLVPYGTYQYAEKVLQTGLRFSEGRCVGQADRLFNGTDAQGRPIQYTMHDSVYLYYFNEDFKDIMRLPDSIELAGNFREGLAPAMTRAKDLGFIDTTGKWQIRPKYELALAGAYPFPQIVIPEFIGGFAYIKAFKGYIDRNGKEYFSGERLSDHYNFSH